MKGPIALLRVIFFFSRKKSFVHGIEKIPVVLCLFELFEQEFHFK